MINPELEKLKEEVETRLGEVRVFVQESENAMLAKIDKIHENELHKTLMAINKRLEAIEKRLEDKDADKEESTSAGKTSLRPR